MNLYFKIVNAFLEDTCVIVVIAYLLARGKVVSLIFREEEVYKYRTVWLGLLFGLLALSEAIFPRARDPYMTSTLIVTFAVLNCGIRPAIMSVLAMSVGALFFQAPIGVIGGFGGGVISVFVGAAVGKLVPDSQRIVRDLTAGMATQTCFVLFESVMTRYFHSVSPVIHTLSSVAANGFGVMLLGLVINDARIRAESMKNRLKAERAHSLVVEAQVRAIQAKIRPHFLFNTLTSISALCSFAPAEAEKAILNLSEIMRQTLVRRPDDQISLAEELEAVRKYLEIEQYRYGSRLTIEWVVEPACDSLKIPAFSLQTLVENAVHHGISKRAGNVKIIIVARSKATFATFAVFDDGVGIARMEGASFEGEEEVREHGLQILTAQLTLLHGSHSRIRLLSRESNGTIAAFSIPFQKVAK